MDFRFVAYDPQTGDRLYQLPRANSVSIGDTFGTRGTLELTYSAKAVNARDLPTFLEVQAEVTFDEGHNWAPAGPSLLRLSGEHEDTDQVGMRTLRFVGREWVLGKARVGNGDLELIDGKRPFYRASPGQILRTLILEAQDRGAADGIEIGNFTAAKDSSGNAWSKVATIYYSPGLPIGSVLENLVEQGMCDYRMDGRTIHLYNPETTMGRDLTTGDNPVRVHGAVTEAPVKYTLEDLANSALLMGDEGFELEVDNPTAPDDYGRLEVTIEQGGVSDNGTARLMVDEALQRGSREVREITRSQSAAGAAFLPLRDYRVGDYVQVRTGGAWERYRVREIQLARDGDEWTIHTIINDRLQELLLKLAKRTNGIVNGSKGSGGDGTRPTPPEKPGIEPASPEGLVIDQQVYLDRQGIARGQVTAGWGSVTESTKGTAVEIGGYELWWRENKTQAVWTRAAVTDGSITVSHSPVVLTDAFGTAMEYQWRVRAIAEASTRPGPFSDIVTLTMTQDTEPPNVPSLPTVTTDLRIVTVDVDGLDEFGEAMPVDFDHTRIYFAPAEDMVGAEQVGTLTQPGSWNSGSMTPDVPVWVAVSAVDHVGNESTMTPAQSVTPKKLVDDSSIRDELTGIDDKINTAVDDLNQAIENIVVDANGTTTYWMPTAPDETTDPEPKTGDLWFDTSAAGKNRLHRFDGVSWVSAADERINEITTAVDDLNTAIDNIVIDANGTTTYQTPYEPDETTDPKPKAGDLWFNTSDSMKLHRFDGDQWASAADGRIDTIKDVQDEFASDLDEVRISADGKSRIVYSDRAPAAGDEGSADDVWWMGTTLPSARNIVMVGDSITEGNGASDVRNRWQSSLQQRLNPSAPELPFIPTHSLSPVTGWPVIRSGAVKGGAYGYRWGFGWRTNEIYDHNTDDSTPGAVEFSFHGTSAQVVLASASTTGVASISVDGGDPVEFDTNRSAHGGQDNYGLTWGTGPLAPGTHTIRVTRSDASASGNGVWPEGLLVFNGDEVFGTRVIDSGKSGISTSWWTDDAARLTGLVGTSSTPGAFQSLDEIDLVCLNLGVNDHGTGVAVADYKQNLLDFIAAARDAGYAGEFLLIGMNTSAYRDLAEWDTYHQAMQQVADADAGVDYLDIRTLVPQPRDVPGYYADGLHPNDAGHAAIAGAVEPYIRKNYIGGWTVQRQFLHDGTGWNETVVDGQVIANLDAGKITSGYIDAARLKAGTINADTVLVPGSAGSTVIKDGAITTPKIEAGAITAESGIIASLDAGKISVGEMEGARIKAGTVTAEKLLVGSVVQLAPSPDSFSIEWELTGGAVIYPWSAAYDGQSIRLLDGSGAYGPYRETKEGDTWFVSLFCWRYGGSEGSLSVQLFFYDSDKNYLSAPAAASGYSTLSGTVTAPARAAFVRLGLVSTGDMGEGWISIRDIHGALQSPATLIENGAITTGKIAVGAITAESGIIGSLNAGTITVGEMEGSRIKAGTVSAEKLLVGLGSNVLPWSTERISPHVANGGKLAEVTINPTIGKAISVTGGTPGVEGGMQFKYTKSEPYLPCTPGTPYRFRIKLASTGTLQAGTVWRLQTFWYDESGNYIASSFKAHDSLPGMTVTEFAYTAAARDGAYFVAPYLRIVGDFGDAEILIKEVGFEEQIRATLIEDGAITTDKILANAITAGKIAALAIEADHISANAITADKINAGAIDGKLITGARIRTSASGARVELNSEGLKAYRSNGAVVLNTDTSDGSIDMTGRLTQTIGGSTITVGGDYSGGPGIQWSDSNIYAFPPGIRYGKDPDVAGLMTTLVQGPGVTSGNSFLKLNDEGKGFALESWQSSGNNRWVVNSDVPGNYMRIGSGIGDAPFMSFKRGSGDTGQAWIGYNHPTNGGYSSLALRDRYVWLGSYDSGGKVVSRLYGDAESTQLTAGSRNLYLEGKDVFLLPTADLSLNPGGKLYAPGLRRVSSAEHMGRDGDVVLISSSRKYKLIEEPIESTVESFEDKLLSVDAKTWVDRSRAEMIADHQTAIANGEDPKDYPSGMGGLERIPGVVAEDLVDAGLDVFVHFEDGEPESVLYDRIGPAFIPIIRRLRDRVDALETQLGATA